MNNNHAIEMAPDGAPASGRGQRRTQAQRRTQTREKLLQAAIEIIAEAGYERASIAEIGRRAGYSRGIVTHTFGSKPELLRALVRHMFQRWDADSLQPAVDKAVGVNALIIALREVLRQVQENPSETRAFYQLLFDTVGPLPELRPQIIRLHQQLRASIAKWIEAGVDSGEISPKLCLPTQAALYLATIRGAIYQWILDEQNFDIAAVLNEYEDNLKITFSRL